VTDHLEPYYYEGNETDIIEIMEKYRNAYDKDITFSKQGIIEYINAYFEKEE